MILGIVETRKVAFYITLAFDFFRVCMYVVQEFIYQS